MIKLIIVGDDKIGRQFVHRLGMPSDTIIALYKSSSFKRVVKLLWRKTLNLRLIAKMYVANMKRKDYKVKVDLNIYNNKEILKLIDDYRIEVIYIFRAGLIINKKVIDTGIPIFNTHCAKIPQYGGLGAIARALKDGAYDQEATLHRVTTYIDDGEIITKIPFRLDPKLSYFHNEEIAYNAGMELLTADVFR